MKQIQGSYDFQLNFRTANLLLMKFIQSNKNETNKQNPFDIFK